MQLQDTRTTVLVDATVTLVALVAIQLEVWIWWVEPEQGPRELAAVFALGMTLPLAWRRRRPVLAFVVLQAVQTAWILVSVPQGSLVPFLVELVALFTLAQSTGARTAFAGLVATVAVEVLFVSLTTNDFADYMFILAFVTAAWAAGQSLRARQLRADQLFAETVRLEVEKEERVREAADAERARIAHELHDIVSHGMSVMVVQAAAAEQVLATDPDAARAALRAVQDAGRGARLELRRMLGLMRASDHSDALDPQPHVDQLDELLRQFRDAGLHIDLNVEGTAPTLSAGLGLAAYRVLQEALTNVVKHGADKRALVRLCFLPDRLTVEVLNAAGTGADDGAGYGLVGMRERLRLYGGEVTHARCPDGRFRLWAQLPYAEAGR